MADDFNFDDLEGRPWKRPRLLAAAGAAAGGAAVIYNTQRVLKNLAEELANKALNYAMVSEDVPPAVVGLFDEIEQRLHARTHDNDSYPFANVAPPGEEEEEEPKRKSRNFVPHRHYVQSAWSSRPGRALKYLDSYLADTAIPSVADYTNIVLSPSSGGVSLFAVPQGDGDSARAGDWTEIVSLELHGFLGAVVLSDQTAPHRPPAIYMALVQDTQTNGVLFQSSDVFVNPSADAALVAYPYLNLKKGADARFKILTQWHMTDIQVDRLLAQQGGGAFAHGCEFQI